MKLDINLNPTFSPAENTEDAENSILITFLIFRFSKKSILSKHG